MDVKRESLDAVRRFVAAINSRSPDRIAERLTADHRFIDSLGVEISGREAVAQAWRRYFELVPDYRISVASILENSGDVALFGQASGSVAGSGENGEAWSVPFAARARVESCQIAIWQVYADNEPVRAILRRRPAL